MGLPRDCRLTHKQQFDRVLNSRTIQVRQGPFRAYAVANGEVGARLGLIIGKRHAKRAVERNRIKRVLRESFRNGRTTLPRLDVVVQLVEAATGGNLAVDAHALWPVLTSEFEKANVDRRSA
jgi:ribonuclease P protein component